MYIFSAILIGMAGAFLGGMFGVGGAGLTTPALRVILRTSPGLALGTTLPVTIPTALAGAFTYNRRRLVDWRTALFCSVGGVAGSIGGAWITKILNLHYLMLATGLLVLYLSVDTMRKGRSGELSGPGGGGNEEIAREERYPSKPSAVLLVGIGIACGFFSGLLGVGGGIVLMPAFIYILRIPLKKAFGTSLAVIAVVAIPGTVVHALLGHISGWLFLYLTIGVIPGAYLGARLSIRTREPLMYVLFGVMLGVFSVIFIVNEIISIIC